MSDTQRIRKTLLRIQDKLKSLGSSNRNRWASLSTGSTMGISQFISKVKTFNVQFEDSELMVILDTLEIPDNLTFTEFVKFMQADVDEFVPRSSGRQISSDRGFDEPAPRFAPQGKMIGEPSADSIIHENLREIINSCMDVDTLLSGEVSKRQFSDICKVFGINEFSPSWKFVINAGDPLSSGIVSYFAIAKHVCKSDSFGSEPVSRDMDRFSFETPKMSFDPPPRSSYDQQYNQEPKRPSPQDNQRKTAFEQTTSNESQRKAPIGSEYRRAALEKSNIFGEPEIQTRITPRNRVPDSPYGEQRPNSSSQNQFSGKVRVEGLPPNELSKAISKHIMETMGSTKNAFQKWRGMNDRLNAEDVRQGLFKDANVAVPIEDLEILFRQHGSSVNLTGFVKMMSNGSEFSGSSSSSFEAPQQERKKTVDEQALDSIASQLGGKDWEQIIFKANSTDDVMRGFKRINVVANEDEVRRLMSKLGKTGLIDTLKQKTH